MKKILLGQTLKKLRVQKNKTQTDIAKIIKKSQQSYAKYELGMNEPDIQTLNSLAEYYCIPVDVLTGNKIKIGIKVPVLGEIPAGVPLDAIENIEDYEEISEALAATGEFFALKVKGDSMSPQILAGDVIIFRVQEDADNGSTCVVFVNGDDATLKRIKKSSNGITLLPNNPAYEPMFFNNQEIIDLPIRILGKAIEIRRGI